MQANVKFEFADLPRQLGILWATMLLLAFGLSRLTSYPFSHNLTYSLCISTTIFALSRLLDHWRGDGSSKWTTAIIAIPLGTALGVSLAALLLGQPLHRMLTEHPDHLVVTLVVSLIFGTGFSYYFYARETIAKADASLRAQSLVRAADERRMIESHLKLLQAQIEPHFLFNTLSNILSLIREEPEKAEHMLQDLTEYLRVSLQRTRTAQVTLADELRLLRAYFNIQQIRMGPRLHFSIEVPDSLLPMRLPPLILQPLAENCIRHGIEPLAHGGEVTIRAWQEGDLLQIEIADTGAGMAANSNPGVGISNVRERLSGLYGTRGSIALYPNTPSGLRIVLTMPTQLTEASA